MKKHTDWFLDVLIDAASAGDIGVDIILYFPGMMIAGSLIGQPDYFRALSDFDIAGYDWPSVADMVAERERQTKNEEKAILLQAGSEGREELNDEESDRVQELGRRYVHLKNARAYGLNPFPISIPLWRGQLLDVVGWNFGSIPD